MPYIIDKKYPYVCSKCGVSGVKLWRQYQTCACYVELECAKCAEPNEIVDGNGTIASKYSDRTDNIGQWLVPAIPTADGTNTYWGYTSVPTLGIVWWKSLPTYPGQNLDYKNIVFKYLNRTMKDAIYIKAKISYLKDIFDEKLTTIDISNYVEIDKRYQKNKHDGAYIEAIFSQGLLSLLQELNYAERMNWITQYDGEKDK